MQINEDTLIRGMWWVIVTISGAFLTLLGYFWKGDRKRLKTLEEQVSQAITKEEVDVIVADVKREFRQEHQSIITQIDRRHDELREDIRDLRNMLSKPWNGQDKRNP